MLPSTVALPKILRSVSVVLVSLTILLANLQAQRLVGKRQKQSSTMLRRLSCLMQGKVKGGDIQWGP